MSTSFRLALNLLDEGIFLSDSSASANFFETLRLWVPVTTPVLTLLLGVIGFYIAVKTFRANEREKERAHRLSLKKEVYYSVYADWARFQMFLIQLPTRSMEEIRSSTFLTDWAAALSKLQLVAGGPVLREANKLGALIRAEVGKLITVRAKLEKIEKTFPQDEGTVNFDVRDEFIHGQNALSIACQDLSLRVKEATLSVAEQMREEIGSPLPPEFGSLMAEELNDLREMINKLRVNVKFPPGETDKYWLERIANRPNVWNSSPG